MVVEDLLSKIYVKIDQKESVSKLVGKLKSKKSREALVFSRKSFVGVVDERKFLKLRLDANKTKVQKIVKRCPKLKKTTSVEEAARLMGTSVNAMLPVVDNDQVKGVVYVWDLLPVIAKNKKLAQLRAVDLVKKKNLVTIKSTDPLSKAISLFKKKSINRLPVVDKGSLVGIVTPRDIIKKYMLFDLSREGGQGRRLPLSHPGKNTPTSKLPIGNEMSRSVSTVDVQDRLPKAIHKMVAKQIGSVVVTKNGDPYSILTVNDVLRLF